VVEALADGVAAEVDRAGKRVQTPTTAPTAATTAGAATRTGVTPLARSVDERSVDVPEKPAGAARTERAGVRRAQRSTVLAHGTDRDRRHVAVVITSDGRRVQMPMDSGLFDVSLLLRSLALGLESLLALITGSRRENGGTRRDRDR
jgi:hypothetical protein